MTWACLVVAVAVRFSGSVSSSKTLLLQGTLTSIESWRVTTLHQDITASLCIPVTRSTCRLTSGLSDEAPRVRRWFLLRSNRARDDKPDRACSASSSMLFSCRWSSCRRCRRKKTWRRAEEGKVWKLKWERKEMSNVWLMSTWLSTVVYYSMVGISQTCCHELDLQLWASFYVIHKKASYFGIALPFLANAFFT